MKKFTVLIIGAGRIGAFFDTPDSAKVLTHAHAFSAHPGFEIVGFVDANRDQANKAAAIWGGAFFSSIEEAFAHFGETIDVAVNATPDDIHYDVLTQLFLHNVQLISTEKPVATSLEQAQELYTLAKEKNIPVLLNYNRQFVPEFVQLKKQIDAGELGEFLTGSGYYGKGLLHNGSHMFALLRGLIGEVKSSHSYASNQDFTPQDPSISVVLEFAHKAHVVMQAIDQQNFTIFELDLLFRKGRVRMTNSGFSLERQTVIDDPNFNGYRILSPSQTEATSLGTSLSFVVENMYQHLTAGEKLQCTIEDGYHIMKTISQIARPATHT